MKNTIKNSLFVIALLFLASSFTNNGSDAPSVVHGKTTLKVSPAGGAYVLFANKYGGKITKKELEGHQEIKVEGCAKGSRIFQFSLEVTKGGKTTTFHSKSQTLSKEMIAALKALSSGDAFEFKNTKACMPNGKDVVDVRCERFFIA